MMYRTIFYLLAFLFFLQTNLQAQTSDSALLSYYKKIIITLADDSMKGRPAGSIYEEKCSRFIEAAFKERKNSRPKFHPFTFNYPDSAAGQAARNVYCFINNKKDSTILIGAHYDHIGMGGALSRSLLKKGIHNGADDNASGIALILGLFKNYNQWKNPDYNYLFVAYSAHEIGLFGSSRFSEFVVSDKFKKIALVVNVDMVGRMDNQLRWLKITATENSPLLAFFGEKKSGLNFRTEPDYLLMQSDAKEFYKNGITCFSFSTGIHDDYHKVSDDESKINYMGILAIQKLLEEWIKQL